MDSSSHHFSTDSFSISWLININNNNSNIIDHHAQNFINMDSEFFSMRWRNDDANHDFAFTLPKSQTSDLVNADRLISNGRLLPIHVQSAPNSHANPCNASTTSIPSSCNSNNYFNVSKRPCSKNGSFRAPMTMRSRVAESPKKIVCKYLFFLMPLYNRVRGFRLRTLKLSRNCRTSSRSSTRTNNAFSGIEWCRSNADISIYDAILHCKRSNGQEK